MQNIMIGGDENLCGAGGRGMQEGFPKEVTFELP